MIANDDIQHANEATRQAWDANAAFWDEKMAEGNDFVNPASAFWTSPPATVSPHAAWLSWEPK